MSKPKRWKWWVNFGGFPGLKKDDTYAGEVIACATEHLYTSDQALIAASPLMMEALGVCKWLSLELDIPQEGIDLIQEACDAIDNINRLREEESNGIVIEAALGNIEKQIVALPEGESNIFDAIAASDLPPDEKRHIANVVKRCERLNTESEEA